MPSLRVNKIEHGTVIDHIPAGNGRKLLDLLVQGTEEDRVISLIMNVQSTKMGQKDIVKIEDRELEPWEAQSAAVFAPNATLNVIADYDVVDKDRLQVPDTITGVLDCPNPECVTNTDEPVDPRLTVETENPIHLYCTYCETTFTADDVGIPQI